MIPSSARVKSLYLNVHRRHSIRLQRPQPGGSAYSTGISMLGRKNRRVRFLAENVLLKTGWNIMVEPRNLRSTSAHHYHIRIQKIDHLRQSAHEPILESIDRGKRGGFAHAAPPDDLVALERNARREIGRASCRERV